MIIKKTNNKIKLWQLNLVVSLLFITIYNVKLWKEVFHIVNPHSFSDYLFIASIFTLVTLIINLILNLICTRYTYKVAYFLIFIGAALGMYFIHQYNIIIDRDMVQNAFETNPAEAKDLFNFKMLGFVLFLGIMPAVIFIRKPVLFRSFKQELISKLKLMALIITAIIALLYISYPTYASLARNNRHLSHLIIPTNFIFATASYLKQNISSKTMPFKEITQGTKLGDKWNNIQDKTILVIVVGETARADRFGLNGYKKQTTPKLAKRNISNFDNTYSCGTNTATSLPCMFSHLDRDNYSQKVAKNTENLLDFLTKTGFSVQWRDNNTGCKGICNRVDTLDLASITDNPLCETGECFDEILLDKLASQIQNNPKNQIIVLHQKGSHGPSYYLRYPKAFEQFTPVCANNQLQKCQSDELDNAYDNTIYYTDYVVDKTISLLENLPKNYNTSLLYLSDHGESLGENNIYLHGTPYFMAPEAQIHVPFFTWMSATFKQNFTINQNCLTAKKNQSFSHDNLFHSVLGLLHIETSIYNAELDIFKSCQN